MLSALNLILSSHPRRTQPGGGVMVGRNRFFFPSTMDPAPLGGALEAWKGFYSSVRPSFKHPMVNVNVATTAFYTPGNRADSMNAFAQASVGARRPGCVTGVPIGTQ